MATRRVVVASRETAVKATALLHILPEAPIVTVQSVADMTDRTFQSANAASARFVEADILRNVKIGRRNRAFEAPEIIEAFAMLEPQLAGPVGDTARWTRAGVFPIAPQCRPGRFSMAETMKAAAGR